MKKLFQKSALIFISIAFFSSCGTTKKAVATKEPEQNQESVQEVKEAEPKTQEESLPEIEAEPEVESEDVQEEEAEISPYTLIVKNTQAPTDKEPDMAEEKTCTTKETKKSSEKKKEPATETDTKIDSKSIVKEPKPEIKAKPIYVETAPGAKAITTLKEKSTDKKDSLDSKTETSEKNQADKNNAEPKNLESQKAESKSKEEEPQVTLKKEQTEPKKLESKKAESKSKEEEPQVTLKKEQTEKVSEEDSKLEKKADISPTGEEKSKVSEYNIIEEPKVKNLTKEEEPKAQKKDSSENKEESHSKEQAASEKEAKSEKKAESQIPEETKPGIADNTDKKEESAQDSESENKDKTEEEQPPIIPSRKVSLKNGQYLDVDYPGTGWIYLGESEKDTLFNYFGRKIGTGSTSFSLRAKKSGTSLLHFYKNDALTGEYIDDYLEVTVLGEKGSGKVTAPSYAEIIPAKPQRRIDRANERNKASEVLTSPKSQAENRAVTETKKEEKKSEPLTKTQEPAKRQSQPQAQFSQSEGAGDIKTVIRTTDAEKKEQESSDSEPAQTYKQTPISSQSIQQEENEQISSEPTVVFEESKNEGDESLLEKAKKDFEAKNYELALSEAQEYYNTASTRLDEALYLLGQIWESDSKVKNIRSSIDSYDSLIKNYPMSKLWKKANNRSIYLKRFYIDIR